MSAAASARGENAAVNAAARRHQLPAARGYCRASQDIARHPDQHHRVVRAQACIRSAKPATSSATPPNSTTCRSTSALAIVDESPATPEVKITVIATGCQGETAPVGDLGSELAARIDPARDSHPSCPLHARRRPPPPLRLHLPRPPAPVMHLEPEAELGRTWLADAEFVLDLDDLDSTRIPGSPGRLQLGRRIAAATGHREPVHAWLAPASPPGKACSPRCKATM